MVETGQTRVVIPDIGYRDAWLAIEFLTALGFEVDAVYDGPDERTVGVAELHWPAGGGVMLHTDNGVSPQDRRGVGVLVVTDNPDAVYKRALESDITVGSPPTDKDRGTREFVVTDHEGVMWSFATATFAESQRQQGQPT